MINFQMKRLYIMELIRGRCKSMYYNVFFKGTKISKKLRMGRYSHINIWSNGKLLMGQSVYLRKFCQIHIESGRLVIGNNTFLNNFVTINCLDHIVIGDNCLFGEGVKLYDHNHKYHNSHEIITKQGYTSGQITIGNNCWIGSNVIILKGVKIGDNVIIGANVLVFKDIPPNHIVKSQPPVIESYK